MQKIVETHLYGGEITLVIVAVAAFVVVTGLIIYLLQRARAAQDVADNAAQNAINDGRARRTEQEIEERAVQLVKMTAAEEFESRINIAGLNYLDATQGRGAAEVRLAAARGGPHLNEIIERIASTRFMRPDFSDILRMEQQNPVLPPARIVAVSSSPSAPTTPPEPKIDPKPEFKPDDKKGEDKGKVETKPVPPAVRPTQSPAPVPSWASKAEDDRRDDRPDSERKSRLMGQTIGAMRGRLNAMGVVEREAQNRRIRELLGLEPGTDLEQVAVTRESKDQAFLVLDREFQNRYGTDYRSWSAQKRVASTAPAAPAPAESAPPAQRQPTPAPKAEPKPAVVPTAMPPTSVKHAHEKRERKAAKPAPEVQATPPAQPAAEQAAVPAEAPKAPEPEKKEEDKK